MGGGGSIALAAFDTSVVLVGCVLTTGTGGTGGNGASGAAGSSGGARGVGSGTSCNGGNGGQGSAGGAGGGGAGGVSIGILFHGGTVSPDVATQIMVTTSGAATQGTGGDPGVNDGKVGVVQPMQDAALL